LGELEQLLERGDSIAPTLAALYWIPVPTDGKARLELALVWAAAFGGAWIRGVVTGAR
jgi:hypothetical protein